MPKKVCRKDLQGGLSDGVFSSGHLQNYVCKQKKIPIFGYVGSSGRTRWKDKILEEELRAVGLGDEGVGDWLTSTSARHLMDAGTSIRSKEQFRKHSKGFVKDAFIEETLWNHPDHTGMLTSTIELRKKIKKNIC